MTSASRTVVFALLLPAAGCSVRADSAETQPSLRVVVPTTSLPSSCPFLGARIVAETRPAESSGGAGHAPFFGGGTRLPAREVWRLELEGKPGPRRVELAVLPLASGRPPSMRAALSAAADGHAVAVSLDGGATWRAVVFDVPDHLLYVTDPWPGPAAGLWSRVPDTRTLVAGILEAAARGSADTGEGPQGGVRLGIRYACAHPDDEALARAATQSQLATSSLVLVGTQNAAESDACALDLARRHASVRADLRSVLRAPPEAGTPDQRRAIAAWVLAGSGGTDDQRALAEASDRPPGPDRPREGLFRVTYLWALAAITTRLGSAPSEVVSTLVAWATGPDRWEYVWWSMVRAQAVRALAAVQQDAAAREALERLAKGACRAPLPAWPTRFEHGADTHLLVSGHGLACWAQAAVALRPVGLRPAE